MLVLVCICSVYQLHQIAAVLGVGRVGWGGEERIGLAYFVFMCLLCLSQVVFIFCSSVLGLLKSGLLF